jgi:hypothetical protein
MTQKFPTSSHIWGIFPAFQIFLVFQPKKWEKKLWETCFLVDLPRQLLIKIQEMENCQSGNWPVKDLAHYLISHFSLNAAFCKPGPFCLNIHPRSLRLNQQHLFKGLHENAIPSLLWYCAAYQPIFPVYTHVQQQKQWELTLPQQAVSFDSQWWHTRRSQFRCPAGAGPQRMA